MAWSRLIKIVRAVWREPAGRRVIEFVLISGGWLVLFIFMDKELVDTFVPFLLVVPVLLFARMASLSVLCKEPKEATREIVIASTQTVLDQCMERALSLRYRVGWKSGDRVKHFVRGSPEDLQISSVHRDEIFVILDNTKPSVIIRVRTWTERTLGSSDPAAQALEEFVNALQESHVKVESTKHVQDADLGLELFAFQVIRVGLRHCKRAFLAMRNGAARIFCLTLLLALVFQPHRVRFDGVIFVAVAFALGTAILTLILGFSEGAGLYSKASVPGIFSKRFLITIALVCMIIWLGTIILILPLILISSEPFFSWLGVQDPDGLVKLLKGFGDFTLMGGFVFLGLLFFFTGRYGPPHMIVFEENERV